MTKKDPFVEIGKQLTADDLKVQQIVVIEAPERNGVCMTMWVREVRANLVVFYSGELDWYVINFVSNDGTIIDDQGREVKVYEYLGDP